MASGGILAALGFVWSLIPAAHRPALIGGLAMTAWKRPRFTHDVDLLIAVEPQKVDELLQHLNHAGLRRKQRRDGQSGPLSLGPVDLVQFLYAPPGAMFEYQVDLLIARGEFHRQALTRAVVRHLPGMNEPVRVVACEDLILLKLLAGRAIDHVDARHILSANLAGIDLKYLGHWAAELDVMTPLQSIWALEFPDRALPDSLAS